MKTEDNKEKFEFLANQCDNLSNATTFYMPRKPLYIDSKITTTDWDASDLFNLGHRINRFLKDCLAGIIYP